jgi:polyisoprenoid-binding protein YceI
MKKVLVLLVLALSFGVVSAQNLVNDPAHSKLGFSVTHLKISTVEGDFKDFTVQLSSFDPNNIDSAKFTVVANLNSVNTGIEGRDNHLKSNDFFDTARYPKLEFKTKTISKIKKNRYKLIGDLTIRGVTKPVSLLLVYNGEAVVDEVTIYGFTIKGRIDRMDFGVGKDFSNASVSYSIEITSNIQFQIPNKK